MHFTFTTTKEKIQIVYAEDKTLNYFVSIQK